jgi:hypothetical protein
MRGRSFDFLSFVGKRQNSAQASKEAISSYNGRDYHETCAHASCITEAQVHEIELIKSKLQSN